MVTADSRIRYDLHYLDQKTANRFIGLRRLIASSLVMAAVYFGYRAMMTTQAFMVVITLVCGLTGFSLFKRIKTHALLEKRINYILSTPLPASLWLSRSLRYRPFNAHQKQLIEDGLRDYFILHALFPTKPLAMPSELVDKLWHAFILDTKAYQSYCQHAFGKLFHHIPDYQFSNHAHNIRLFTWQIACRLQGIRPARPHDLPRLSAIDPLLVAGVTIGSAAWHAYRQALALQYQAWYATSQTSSSGGSSYRNDNDYDDRCDIDLTDSGDTCSSSGNGGDSSGSDSGGDSGSDSGGGCGGGGGGD